MSSATAPRLIKSSFRPQLGDILQRLALVSPNDLHYLARLAQDVLSHAEADHKRRFPHGIRQDLLKS